jgi:hypothetical protein
MISTDERTLSFGVNSFGVIANDDRLYLVVLAGSFFFSQNREASDLSSVIG